LCMRDLDPEGFLLQKHPFHFGMYISLPLSLSWSECFCECKAHTKSASDTAGVSACGTKGQRCLKSGHFPPQCRPCGWLTKEDANTVCSTKAAWSPLKQSKPRTLPAPFRVPLSETRSWLLLPSESKRTRDELGLGFCRQQWCKCIRQRFNTPHFETSRQKGANMKEAFRLLITFR